MRVHSIKWKLWRGDFTPIQSTDYDWAIDAIEAEGGYVETSYDPNHWFVVWPQ